MLDRLGDIPPADLAVIRAKPSSYDRKADQRWRSTCARWGIDTSPSQDTIQDRAVYDRNRYLERRLEQLEAERATLREERAAYEARAVKAEAVVYAKQHHPRS